MGKEREGQKILIVDDKREHIVFLANDILKPKGYNIIAARDGENGLRRALKEKPDLIIMDLKMPKMSGLEMLTALREKQCHVPVILATFHGSESVAIEAFRLGIKDYIIKPYTVEEMERAIERALGEEWAEEKAQSPDGSIGPPQRLAEGQRPELAEGQRPELAEGQRPELAEGQRPELAEGLRERIKEINQQWKRRVSELGTLHDIGRVVTSLLDLEKVASRVVEAAVFLAAAEEGSLLLVDQETQELYVRAAQGPSQKEARSLRVKVDDSLAGHVVTTGRPIMVNSVQNQKKFKLKTGVLIKALLHVPLKLGDEVIGVLSVHNKVLPKALTDNDLQALTILAGYAAVAIENAQRYQSMEEKAQQLSQILSDQKRKTKENTDRVMQLMHEIEIHEQRLKESKEEAEQLAAAAKELVERLKAQERLH
jgi:two-component system NtrC family sensor kinase